MSANYEVCVKNISFRFLIMFAFDHQLTLYLCGQVADCVCLMSLDKAGAIPVDTHVWQFAARHYLPKLQAAKSVTDKLYKEIGEPESSVFSTSSHCLLVSNCVLKKIIMTKILDVCLVVLQWNCSF